MPPTQKAWSEWIETLKDNDEVTVYYTNGEPIYNARVRITPTGKIYLRREEGRKMDRTNWRHYRVNVLGASTS